MAQTLSYPHNVRETLTRMYQRRHRSWLLDTAEWPLALPLGKPSEEQVTRHPETVKSWVAAWEDWRGQGEVTWCQKRWRTLGTQKLPEKLILSEPPQVADWIGESERWRRAHSRYVRLKEKWIDLGDRLPALFDMLSDEDESELDRLEALVSWLHENPNSNLYPRQLPVSGVDSKWLEEHKRPIVLLISGLQKKQIEQSDIHDICGLRRLPVGIHVRFLDREIRRMFAGLSDVIAPIDDLRRSYPPVKTAFIVENQQTGLAFPDVPGAIVIMGLGYAVESLQKLHWLHCAKLFYWGDLDTHGFAMLNRIRSYLPNVQSVLMDEQTLLSHQPMWVREDKQVAAAELSFLTPEEHSVFVSLKQNKWSANVRLEQERINWSYAWETLTKRTDSL